MFRKLLRICLTIAGASIGYGFCMILRHLFRFYNVPVEETIGTTQFMVISIFVAIIIGIIFFRISPAIGRGGKKVASEIERDLRDVAAKDLVLGSIGLILGLIIAFFITQIYSEVIKNTYIFAGAALLTYLFMGYLGVILATSKGKDIFATIMSVTKGRAGEQSHFGKRKKLDIVPKILDTSVIIDGRILDIMRSGFIEGRIVIPEFVLVELRHIADSSDSLKRVRGRRGLDILKSIQEEFGIDIYNTNNEKAIEIIPEVDVKLIKLAQIMKGKVVTNDFNLNKVATINDVEVLNINALANAVKAIVIPGDEMVINLVKEGKDDAQAVGYLDDGTMIVVEDGRPYIGETKEILVTSMIQTAAGRMIFGRVKK